MKRVVLVPVKPPGRAKSRLRGVLADEERAYLALQLCRRAIGAALGAARVDEVYVVSRDAGVLEEAMAAGAVPVDEGALPAHADDAEALNAALEHGRRLALEHDADQLAVVMADLPRVESQDVDALFEALEQDLVSVVLAPDEDGRGLGALALSPADNLPFAFGGGRAFERHLAAARERALVVVELCRGGLAFDLDTSVHLAAIDSLESIAGLSS